jgi:signal-transduction protein with cAMP-binding, CBS, and nucleotidyltransferase domain
MAPLAHCSRTLYGVEDGAVLRSFLVGGASMTKLRDIMVPGFVNAVQRGATIADAVRTMTERNVGIVAVLDGDRLVGLVSERDVVRRVVAVGRDPATTLVDEVMTREIVFAGPNEEFQEAVQLMDAANIRHLPVVENGALLSMISVRDLLRVELHARREEIRYLREYMFHAPAETIPT